MKIRLNVKCTYYVECEFDDVPEKIANQLLEMDEVKEGTDVYDWLSDNIIEFDACDWEYDVLNAEKLEGGKHED